MYATIHSSTIIVHLQWRISWIVNLGGFLCILSVSLIFLKDLSVLIITSWYHSTYHHNIFHFALIFIGLKNHRSWSLLLTCDRVGIRVRSSSRVKLQMKTAHHNRKKSQEKGNLPFLPIRFCPTCFRLRFRLRFLVFRFVICFRLQFWIRLKFDRKWKSSLTQECPTLVLDPKTTSTNVSICFINHHVANVSGIFRIKKMDQFSD